MSQLVQHDEMSNKKPIDGYRFKTCVISLEIILRGIASCSKMKKKRENFEEKLTH